jgi:hypothetical protein
MPDWTKDFKAMVQDRRPLFEDHAVKVRRAAESARASESDGLCPADVHRLWQECDCAKAPAETAPVAPETWEQFSAALTNFLATFEPSAVQRQDGTTARLENVQKLFECLRRAESPGSFEDWP